MEQLQKQQYFDWMQKGLNCWQKCEDLIYESLEHGKYLPAVNACRAVADMCSQCIKFQAQELPFFKQLCELCSQICEACLKKLGKYQNDNKLIVEVMYCCRVFSVACLEMSQLPQKMVASKN